MKKLTALFLAVIIILQMNFVAVDAQSSDSSKRVITISNIDTSSLFRNSPRFTTEIRVDGVVSTSFKIISEKWFKPSEFIISSKDIPLTDGVYSYELRIRTDGTLNFNNDLEILYQGINGHYQLDYTIDETDNHIMIVTGLFENIITASPALDTLPEKSKEWVLDNFSDDSYFYELNLRTQEGFTFTNRLQFMFRSIPCVYSIDFMYDLLSDRPAIRINGSLGSDYPDYENILKTKEAAEKLALSAAAYSQIINNFTGENENKISEITEKVERISDISSGREVVDKIEQFVSEHRDYADEIRDRFNSEDFKDRVDSILDRIRH